MTEGEPATGFSSNRPAVPVVPRADRPGNATKSRLQQRSGLPPARKGRHPVIQLKLTRQRLAGAGGLPAVLAAGWDVFELIGPSLRERQATSPDVSRVHVRGGAAVSGRDAIAVAPSCPCPGKASTTRPSRPETWTKSPTLWRAWRRP